MTPAPRVLLADEQHLMLWALERTFAAKGCRVAVARSGAEVLEQLHQGPFDCVVMACRLHDVDMMDVIVEIDREQPEVELVALCRGDCAERLASRLTRGKVHVSPFDVDELAESVRLDGGRLAVGT